MLIKNRFVTYIIALASIILTGAMTPQVAQAADARSFNPARIIDDGVFTNSNSMSIQDIQNFFNSKVTCDTWGVKTSELGEGTRRQWMANRGISPPFRCVTDYFENASTKENNYGKSDRPSGSISAAEIVYNYSRQFNINPQVIIATLQKENGMITDEWPTPKQFTEAMGFACPDNVAPGAPACDPAYKSFSAQVYQAARHFRGYIDNASGWFIPYNTGNNSILWNPNQDCGRSTVNIENRATVALYSYTPYRPNQAALNAQYGTGDGCSAYGNRNFYLYFTDWFGTVSSKPLIRTESSGALYYSDGTNKFPVHSMDVVRQYGLTSSDVGFISQSSLDSIPQSTTTKFLTHYAKSASDTDGDGSTIYLISDGKRYAISSMAQMDRFNLDVSNVTYLPYYTLNTLPLAGTLSDFVNGNDGFVYKIDQAKKSGIFQPSTYSRLNPSGNISKLSQYILDTIDTTTPTIDGYIGLKGADGKVWIATSTSWSYVPSMNVIDCVGLQTKTIANFTPQQALIGPQSDAASCILSDATDGMKYIVDNKVKYPVRDTWGLTAKPALDTSMLSNKNTVQTQDLSVFSNTSNGSLYTFENGTKRYVTSMGVLGELGQTEASILKISGGILSRIPNGHSRYQTNKILQDKSTGQLYVIEQDSKRYIPSMNVFNHYDYTTTSITALESSLVAKHTSTTDTLGTMFKSESTTYLIDRGVRIVLPADIIEHYNAASVPTYNIALAHRATDTTTGTRYIKSSSSPQLFYLENGSRRPVHSWATFTQLGGTNDNITTLSESNITLYPVGSNM